MCEISVIIPTYNRANMVCDCVDSVLAQKGVTLEVIVVDDCSPDDTWLKIKERFGNDGRVRYIRNEKKTRFRRFRATTEQRRQEVNIFCSSMTTIFLLKMRLRNSCAVLNAIPTPGLSRHCQSIFARGAKTSYGRSVAISAAGLRSPKILCRIHLLSSFPRSRSIIRRHTVPMLFSCLEKSLRLSVDLKSHTGRYLKNQI